MLKWILVLWPSFITASLGEIAFFALIDPAQLYLMGKPVDWDPISVYSVGFFMLWTLTALTAALNLLLQTPAPEIKRFPRPQPCRQGLCLRAA